MPDEESAPRFPKVSLVRATNLDAPELRVNDHVRMLVVGHVVDVRNRTAHRQPIREALVRVLEVEVLEAGE